MIGRTVAGRFRIQSVIARGGMGKVYRAEQVPLGRDCAVKILNPKYEGEDDPEFRRRFLRGHLSQGGIRRHQGELGA